MPALIWMPWVTVVAFVPEKTFVPDRIHLPSPLLMSSACVDKAPTKLFQLRFPLIVLLPVFEPPRTRESGRVAVLVFVPVKLSVAAEFVALLINEYPPFVLEG